MILTTKGHDGFPQTRAIWYLPEEDGSIVMSINTTRQKVKNPERNEEYTLFFMAPDTPYRTLQIRARAHMESDPDYTVADRLGARYDADFRERDRPGESRVAVRFAPIKVNTFG